MRPRIWFGCLVLASVAACSGRNGAPDASGIAGASGGGGAAGTGGGQAGNAAAGRGGSNDGGGSTGAGGQAGTSSGGGSSAGGRAGSSAGSGGATGAAGQAGGGGGSTGAGGAAGAGAGTGGRGGSAGTGGRGGSGGGDACALLPGMSFQSVTEEECGRGGLRCRWRISFTASMFNWLHSDVGESGTYTCSGGAITGQRSGSNTIAGQYDAASQTLTWDGLAYTPQ